MITPKHPEKSSNPVKYHCHDSCNKCGEVNEVDVTDTMDGRMMECRTTCETCGHTDYWAHGWFESSQEIESKCATYSFK
ncbi:MAG: hypothetical protein HRU18_00825 [Pseudoalteromonas sp.]|uniref:hypothetical protein n=1 Tax=Pseudoalteromonas sp. TaxID=53249 RepID=UPI001D42EE4E|nr:hypothetical protein [Pseudoalteromonas sp.]NRA76723.1 hypothetical protein [Pseudoalteromonas sp.]